MRIGSWENQFGQFGLLGGRPSYLWAVTEQLRGSYEEVGCLCSGLSRGS